MGPGDLASDIGVNRTELANEVGEVMMGEELEATTAQKASPEGVVHLHIGEVVLCLAGLVGLASEDKAGGAEEPWVLDFGTWQGGSQPMNLLGLSLMPSKVAGDGRLVHPVLSRGGEGVKAARFSKTKGIPQVQLSPWGPMMEQNGQPHAHALTGHATPSPLSAGLGTPSLLCGAFPPMSEGPPQLPVKPHLGLASRRWRSGANSIPAKGYQRICGATGGRT